VRVLKGWRLAVHDGTSCHEEEGKFDLAFAVVRHPLLRFDVEDAGLCSEYSLVSVGA
jgi:hypothetical protein